MLIWILLLAPILFVLALGVRRRRESIRFRFRLLLIGEACYLLVTFAVIQIGYSKIEAIVVGLLVAAVVIARQPSRSRHIPKTERRKAIARFELATGKKYNPRVHELDHNVPFSKGGSSTADNLTVVDRKSNRAKGARSPWWDLLGR